MFRLHLILSVTLFCIFSPMGYGEPSANPNFDVSLEDFFVIEGSYEIEANYRFARQDGTIGEKLFRPMDRFVLFFETKTKSLSASLTSSSTANPLYIFENLEAKYSKDKQSVLLKGPGFGGQAYGELKMSIHMESGQVSGEFRESAATGYKAITGGRIFSLERISEPVEIPVKNVEQLNGVYFGYHHRRSGSDYCDPENDKKPCCGPDGKRSCLVKLLVRAFKKNINEFEITATLSFESGRDGEFNRHRSYTNGVYSPSYGLLEFNQRSAINRRINSKINIRIENGEAEVFFYGTNGENLNYTLKKLGEAEIL